MVTVNTSGSYQLKTTDVDITISTGAIATVVIVPPIPYTIGGQKSVTLLPAQSITLKLNQKNWAISGNTQANNIPPLEANKYLSNDGTRLLWRAIISGVSSVFGRTGNVTAQDGDYTASQVTFVPSGNITATNVQDAIEQLNTQSEHTVDPFYTVALQTAYTIPELANTTVIQVQYGNMMLIPTQWDKPFSSDIFTFTDTSFPVEDGTYVVIKYKL
jgi:hypothetical protein